MVTKKKESGQMFAEAPTQVEIKAQQQESAVSTEKTEEVPQPKLETVEEKKEVISDTEKVNTAILKMQNEYTEDEKPFLGEVVTALVNEGVDLADPNFNLMVTRRILSVVRAKLNQKEQETETLLKRLESIPKTTKVTSRGTSLQSYVQDLVCESESALDYLSVCGAAYCLALQSKLSELGLEVKPDTKIGVLVAKMSEMDKADTKNALAATIRAFSGIRTGDINYAISTRKARKEDAKTAYPRWLIDEAVEEILGSTPDSDDQKKTEFVVQVAPAETPVAAEQPTPPKEFFPNF